MSLLLIQWLKIIEQTMVSTADKVMDGDIIDFGWCHLHYNMKEKKEVSCKNTTLFLYVILLYLHILDLIDNCFFSIPLFQVVVSPEVPGDLINSYFLSTFSINQLLSSHKLHHLWKSTFVLINNFCIFYYRLSIFYKFRFSNTHCRCRYTLYAVCLSTLSPYDNM